MLAAWREAGCPCDKGFELQGPEGKSKPMIVDTYDATFVRSNSFAKDYHQKKYSGVNEATEGQLLMGFFHYFAREFNVDKSVVCITQAEGKVRSKTMFKKPARWRLAVEDPFETKVPCNSKPLLSLTSNSILPCNVGP